MLIWTDRTEQLESTVANWAGGSTVCPDLVHIQGPTQHNPKWRVMTFIRWKDAIHKDCETLEDAKQTGEKLVTEWLDGIGLQFKPETTASHVKQSVKQ